MFNKKELHSMETEGQAKTDPAKEPVQPGQTRRANSIVKGSKLTGDIYITYDLEIDGDVEGNITSDEKSNIVIKGTCKGDIKTKEGNVNISGQMNDGNITAGGDITITGKFTGGKVEAKGKIHVDGEFSGRLEGKEIEIGPGARGKGDIFYGELISIARGADIEVHISRLLMEGKDKSKDKGNPSDAKVVNLELPVREQKS